MQYLVFGILLILGAVGMGLFLYLFHARNKVQAVVLESYCDVKREGREIKSINVAHVFEVDIAGEKKKVKTYLFPVRELNGAKVSLYYNRKCEEVYIPDFTKYFTVLATFFLSGAICCSLSRLGKNGLLVLQNLGGADWLALLFGVIAVVTFFDVTMLINPAVLKTKGIFEGLLKSEDDGCDVEVYSLWYGEHPQYAKRTKGMLLKPHLKKTVVLFYNTKTGSVCRLQEFVISMCVSAIAFLAMIVVLVFL